MCVRNLIKSRFLNRENRCGLEFPTDNHVHNFYQFSQIYSQSPIFKNAEAMNITRRDQEITDGENVVL